MDVKIELCPDDHKNFDVSFYVQLKIYKFSVQDMTNTSQSSIGEKC